MDLSEQTFNDLFSNDDINVDEDIAEDEVKEDLLELNDLGGSSDSDDNHDDEHLDDDKNDDDSTKEDVDFLSAYLKSRGIEDASKIQMQNDNGDIEEVDFNSLSNEEKLNILQSISDPGYTEYERGVINYLRRNNATLDDVAAYYKQQGVEEYLAEHPEDRHQRIYDIDDYTDDEIYLADLKNKYPDFTDEELMSKLDSAKLDTDLFNKEVAAIRQNQKEIEDEQIRQQEEMEAQSYQQLQSNLQQAMSDFVQIELDPDDKEADALALNITDEDRNIMMRYLLERDKNGKSQLVRDLEDPQALIELAYYRTRERDNLTGLTRYWKNELANERKEKAKLQRELERLKDKGKNSSVVPPANKSSKQPMTVMDIYG